MNNSHDLIQGYLSISEEIVSLDFKEEFDKVEKLLLDREEILTSLKEIGLSEEDKKILAEKVIDLDKEILERFNKEKQAIQENLEKVKKEKLEQSNRKKAFNVYGEDKTLEKNVFFDKLK